MSNYETLQRNFTAVPEVGVLLADESQGENERYRVWACDNQVYGPIPESILREWIHDERILRDTWVYVESRKGWYRAETIPELKGAFGPGNDTMFLRRQGTSEQSLDP